MLLNCGNRIKILRMLCGLSQDDLAELLQISQGDIANWEKRNLFPRDEKVARHLAGVLGVSIGYLAYGADDCQYIISSAWEPISPKVKSHIVKYVLYMVGLFTRLLEENGIKKVVYYKTCNKIICFFGSSAEPVGGFRYRQVPKCMI